MGSDDQREPTAGVGVEAGSARCIPVGATGNAGGEAIRGEFGKPEEEPEQRKTW